MRAVVGCGDCASEGVSEVSAVVVMVSAGRSGVVSAGGGGERGECVGGGECGAR
jgi:hypothetical protein